MQAEQTLETVREALRRWLSPLTAWTALIPDISGIPRQRQAAIAIGASAILHLLLLLFIVIGSLVLPEKKESVPPVPPRPLVVELKPRPSDEDADPLVRQRREILIAKGLDPSAEPPKNPDFESDRDMVARSEKPATGLLPLPTQEGRNIPGYEFAEQQVEIAVTPDPQPETVQPPDTKPTTAPSPPVIQPLYKPQPVTPEELASVEKASPADKIPEPATPIKATPPPLKLTDQAKSELAMLVATPRPRPLATPAPLPTFAANLPTPVPRKTFNQRVKENMLKTGVEGNLADAGKNGVNAINTPMGRYIRRLNLQVESIWRLKIRARLVEISVVRVVVKLRRDGSIQSAQVVDDGGSPVHKEICIESLQEMRPEKLPEEADEQLRDGLLEIPFSFTIL